ncbi:CoA ester lyase [Mesorhizobium sp. CO1-1-11]|uniref:HpcH/HpaI aldolase/citrate lyase family protein n=1 Tax=Mesorhizobium sp. CO1-1-11 TaxID=2876636 RepID=UPI001CCF29AD|nr:CoA ester lyase [Mesorhizobium sp. CO1-1-11]MBZ9726302.1 CoA ester lyase [Mesorhizobium sp. CO1-1-11]
MDTRNEEVSGNPAWRSMLFVPATRDRYIEKAASCGADAIVVDLEDSILPEEKDAARARVAAVARRLRLENIDILVRINRPFDLAVRDIEASVGEDVAGLMIAKAESPAHLAYLCEVVENCERKAGIPIGKTAIVPLVETARAIHNLAEICLAPRVAAVACGDEDLAAELGCAPDSPTITSVKYDLVVAAARGNCHPIGMVGSITEFRNLDKYRDSLELTRAVGMRGTLCIHPDQVAVANEAFLPTPGEIRQAQDIVEAARLAHLNGLGTTSVGGKMVDLPVIRRAERLIQRLGSGNA